MTELISDGLTSEIDLQEQELKSLSKWLFLWNFPFSSQFHRIEWKRWTSTCRNESCFVSFNWLVFFSFFFLEIYSHLFENRYRIAIDKTKQRVGLYFWKECLSMFLNCWIKASRNSELSSELSIYKPIVEEMKELKVEYENYTYSSFFLGVIIFVNFCFCRDHLLKVISTLTAENTALRKELAAKE